jgi:hypothetical protein
MNDELEKEKIKLETAKIYWSELQRFFAKGEAIWVSSQLDLIDVAYYFSLDNKEKVQEWLNNKTIAQVPDELALEWFNSNTQLWAVVIKPFVLVQEIDKPI